ncbi:MAG: hypothetical protein KDD61_02590 [Bdellovibrionales bacterium]|nr:hypothetical protein [Bdellovibrionales bacterium]
MSDVVLVSVFGRGNWLAAELAERGLKVALVDVSSSMGRWTPEDWEGPFGLFRSEFLTPLQNARLHEEDDEDAIPDGFCLWLKSGPMDFTGPLSPFLLEQSQLSKECLDYVAQFDSLSDDQRKKAQKILEEQSFSKKWLAYFAHSLASSKFAVSTKSLEVSRPLPLFSPHYIRRVSRRGANRSLEWLREKGVEVYEGATLEDLLITEGRCEGIEVRSLGSGTIHGSRFLWLLTSEETARFSRVSRHLYPQGPLAPDWVWMRYRVGMQENEVLNSLPDKFVIIQDIELEWVHENLCLVQKSVSSLQWDVWVRIPNAHRFRRSYVLELSEKIVALLNSKIPGALVALLDMPQDYQYDESEIGPSRHPIFSERMLKGLQRTSLKNVFFNSPENWSTLDWTGQLQSQETLCKEVVTQYLKELELKRNSNDR